MRFPPPTILAFSIALALGAAGCATTTIVNEWTDPEYNSPRFRRILVIGVSRQPGIRRTFEDEFVARLKAASVDATPSYRYIPEDGRVEEARLREAVRQAEADAVLMTRLVRVERRTEVTPGYYRPAPAVTLGFYRWYSDAWLGYYEPPTIYQRDVYISEASLYDTTRSQLVWAGTAQTEGTGNIRKEIEGYIDTVIDALKKKNLLPSR